MIDTAFLSSLDHFNLIIKKKVTSKYSGGKRSITTGQGIVLKDHRIYSAGDDIKKIDWKVYGRTDDLYVRIFEEERNLVVHSLVDSSASMAFGEGTTKFEYASMLGVGFSYLALKSNEKFLFSTFADNLEIFQSRKGMQQIASVVDHLTMLKVQGLSKFKDTMHQYKKVIGSRSLVFVISDFLFDIDEIRFGLQRLRKNDLKVIQILDPVERGLAIEGDFKLTDSETDKQMRTYITPKMRVQYQKKLDTHIAKIEETCTQLGADFYSFTTDTSIFDAFFKILSN